MKEHKGRRLRKGNAALLAGGLILLTAGLCFGMSALSPLRLYDNAPKVEIDGDFDPRENIYSVFMGSKDDVAISGSVISARPGDYTITYKYKGREWPITVTVADFTPPKLELRPFTAAVEDEVDAESFIALCEDDSRVSLTVDNPGALKNSAGTRSVTITAIDEYGNKTTRTTQLTRIKDSSTPVVKNTESTRTLLIHSVFEPTELDIEDDTDMPCEIDINTSGLDMDKTGTYTVYYTVADTSGNSNRWEETIVVTDDPQQTDDQEEE